MDMITGIEESYDQEQATEFGAFEETALSEEEALETEKTEGVENEGR